MSRGTLTEQLEKIYAIDLAADGSLGETRAWRFMLAQLPVEFQLGYEIASWHVAVHDYSRRRSRRRAWRDIDYRFARFADAEKS